MANRNPLIFFIPLATAVASLLLFFAALHWGWMGYAEGVGASFCEVSHSGIIRQPVNTWSNIGFILAGIYIGYSLWRGSHMHNNNSFTRKDFYAIFFPTLVVLLGPCSMAMHATETHVGGFLDMLSMYLVAGFITAYAAERFFYLKPTYFLILFIVVVLTCLYVQTLKYHVPVVHFIGNFIFGVFITATVVLEGLNIFVNKAAVNIRWSLFSLSALLLAFFIWNLSTSSSRFCDPDSIIQGHAIWHLLNAVSVYCLFRYYVSENEKEMS